MRIHTLSQQLANKIAAGEVVERPASVLKELMENSLDAQSTHIDVVLERGGIGLIQVKDDGTGIHKEDLPLAIAQHATSKIQTAEDLEGIMSYGFRGEALASISAVSRLSVSSAIAGQPMGWRMSLAGRADLPSLVPVPHTRGTTIEICDLFYNTPARRKFLRSEKTELSCLQEVFKRVALSHMQVGFTLQCGEGARSQYRLPVCRGRDAEMRRVATLCGHAFITHSQTLEAEANGMRLKGWIGLQSLMRSQPDLQYFYVNGRIVRDKVINHAVRQAYHYLCLPGRYPAYVLYFEIDPFAVDVNVHPTKHEVRFREARSVHAFLEYSITEGLKKSEVLRRTATAPHQSLDRMDGFPLIPETPRFSFGQPCSIVDDTFVLAQNAAGLVIIDAKAMQSRLLYQQLWAAYQKNAIEKQVLRTPLVMDIQHPIENLALDHESWQRLGFDWTQSGPTTLLLRSVPKVLGSDKMLSACMQRVVALRDVKQQLLVIATHAAAGPLSLADLSGWFQAWETVSLVETEDCSKFYRQVTVDQLRALLMS